MYISERAYQIFQKLISFCKFINEIVVHASLPIYSKWMA